MHLKKICSDSAPLNRREWSVSNCYKRGLSVGFAQGINKGVKDSKNKQKVRRPIIEASAQAILLAKFKSVLIEKTSNDMRKAYLSVLKVPNYRSMSAVETIRILRARGIKRIFIPRV